MVEGERQRACAAQVNKTRGGRVIAGAEPPARPLHQVDGRRCRPARVTAGARVEPNEAGDAAFESGLLGKFAQDRRFSRLITVDETAGQREVPLERRVAAAHEQHAPAVDDDRVGRKGVARTPVGPERDA